MYENQKWVPVASLFGLLGSAIPRSLKTEILHTLTAFARSPEVAAPMWHTLEMAQLLNTRASNSHWQKKYTGTEQMHIDGNE